MRVVAILLVAFCVGASVVAGVMYEDAQRFRMLHSFELKARQKAEKAYDDVCFKDMAGQTPEWRAACVVAAGHTTSGGKPWFCFSREFSISHGGYGASCAGP